MSLLYYTNKYTLVKDCSILFYHNKSSKLINIAFGFAILKFCIFVWISLTMLSSSVLVQQKVSIEITFAVICLTYADCPNHGSFGSSTFPQICSSIWGLGLSQNLVIGSYNILETLHSVAQWWGKIEVDGLYLLFEKYPGDSTVYLLRSRVLVKAWSRECKDHGLQS